MGEALPLGSEQIPSLGAPSDPKSRFQTDRIVGTLISEGSELPSPVMSRPSLEPGTDIDKGPAVIWEELGLAVLWIKAKNTVPGLDGITECAWVLSYDALDDRLRRLFTACMDEGQFRKYPIKIWA